MKEFICKKDFYVDGAKFASSGDTIALLQDNYTIVNKSNDQKVTRLPDIVDLKEYFILKSNDTIQPIVEKEYDNVNHPAHYTSGNIECIDAMIAAFGREDVLAFCKCNAFKYLWRFDKKNGIKDIKKAQWYQNKYIELKDKDS